MRSSEVLQLHQCKIISNGYKQTRISWFGKLINACYGHTKSIFLCHYCKAYLKLTRRRFQDDEQLRSKRKNSHENSATQLSFFIFNDSILNCVIHHKFVILLIRNIIVHFYSINCLVKFLEKTGLLFWTQEDFNSC